MGGNNEGETILDVAIFYRPPKEIVTFLRKNGAKTVAELEAENKAKKSKINE